MFKHHLSPARFSLNVLISCFHYQIFLFCCPSSSTSFCTILKLLSFTICIARSILFKFPFNFYCFIFKDFSHSYSSKLLSSFSGFSVAFLTKSHNCRHSSSIYLVSFSGWSISLFCDLNYVIFISFLFRFLIICFDSSHMIAAYFLHFSISFVLQQTFFQACSILFWIAFYCLYFIQERSIQ